MSKGRLITVIGPSGAGKDTLLEGARRLVPDLVIARRIITRPADAGGEDHEAVDEAGFAARRAAGEFAINWQAHGLSYAIPASILDTLASGRNVVFNGSRAALPVALERFPGLEIAYIDAPKAVLAERLAARGRETAAEILQRLSRRTPDVPPGAHVILNDGSVEEGVARLAAFLSPSVATV